MATKTIHDTFFKDAFTDRDLAVDFLKNYLPPGITKHVRLDTLAITEETFIDKKWDDYYSDLLYTVNFADDRPRFMYFLFEHKSYHDHFLALQMLRYMLEIWELYRKQHKISYPMGSFFRSPFSRSILCTSRLRAESYTS